MQAIVTHPNHLQQCKETRECAREYGSVPGSAGGLKSPGVLDYSLLSWSDLFLTCALKNNLKKKNSPGLFKIPSQDSKYITVSFALKPFKLCPVSSEDELQKTSMDMLLQVIGAYPNRQLKSGRTRN
ncbi:uncharacterized protein [Rhodnius prolixus]|uniref:uncharacterized protein n=1 Tax=Rhodnius prolixus TaxID=13249 RepID=UPI003D189B1C